MLGKLYIQMEKIICNELCIFVWLVKSLMPLEKKMGDHDVEVGKNFLKIMPKAPLIKVKLQNWMH